MGRRSAAPSSTKTFHRIIDGTDEPIVFGLRHFIDDPNGLPPYGGEMLERWIDIGDVSLRVLAPELLLSKDERALLRDEQFIDEGQGTMAHRRLIALAWLYLRKIGNSNACRRGDSSCTYAGGWADACVPDGNYFVECGTLTDRKPFDAMIGGDNLLIIPYTWRPPLHTRSDFSHLAFELRPKTRLEDPRFKKDAEARDRLKLWPGG